MAAADIAVEGDRGRLTDAGLDPSVERQAVEGDLELVVRGAAVAKVAQRHAAEKLRLIGTARR
jgi:hypothetical protein